MLKILLDLLVLAIAFYLMNQVRKPDRWIGKFFAQIMNRSHATLTDWGLGNVEIKEDYTILDIGCGGGRTISKLALRASAGKIYGVDYAKGSVAAATSFNSDLVRSGRATIQEASVSKLPFESSMFDIVTAIETQYYWPDMVNDLREVLRVLKPGATLTIVAETYGSLKTNWLEAPVMFLLRAKILTPKQQEELLTLAGYESIKIVREEKKGWICVLASKPF